jgi:hypothetical protein
MAQNSGTVRKYGLGLRDYSCYDYISPVPIEGLFPKTIVFLGALVCLFIAGVSRKETEIATQYTTNFSDFGMRGLRDIGTLQLINHSTHHYQSRQQLPPFSEMLSITDNSVDFVGLDFRIIMHQYMSVIRDLIYRSAAM